jgi:hypothetical protein
MAQELERVLSEAIKERKRVGAGPDRPVSIDFEYQPHSNEPQSVKSQVKLQHLSVGRRSYMGSQWSFFRNLSPDHSPTTEDTISWKEDHEVTNHAFPQIIITVAGGIGTGICHYISKYGFYEGGKSNPYRVDPAILHWVLTGIPSTAATSAVLSFCQASKAALQAQLAQQLQEFKSADASSESLISISEELTRSCNDQISHFEAIEASLETNLREVET